MASGILMLLDDIATLLDDVAVMSKLATKKTAGIIGDDLALNANQVTGVSANRELPVVWKVFLGSMLNKIILVPIALLISFFAPILIKPLLLIGGLFLCYEGVEKVIHYLQKYRKTKENLEEKEKLLTAFHNNIDLVEFEKDKIKGAVKTDFILSAEIIAIILGTVSHLDILRQSLVLFLVSFGVTIFVYLTVAAIVKFDDLGLKLKSMKQNLLQKIGDLILDLAPILMKLLSIIGTIAMFLVGGGIISHTFWSNNEINSWNLGPIFTFLFSPVLGIISGFIIVYLIKMKNNLTKKKRC